ncbi:hypothetical protein GGX14DRAFT_483725 [Mycena pura]|uniref:Uncharacterized protein n=1 Tax=Mycena pura TaxID=153505 RepID=A0AAD6XXZ1_9AGAR|nr:hypothetical protein GGX14DRAFT_483725 [Mycena pura]
MPSIFDKLPQEHAEASARTLEKQRETVIWPPETLVPPGHVKVQFYTCRFKVRDGLRPDIEAVFPLDPSGALSLYAVRRLWGLETCSIIDPLQLKLGFSADPNFLPARVVNELVTKHGCIKLVEPYASYETLAKREIRQIALACTSILHAWFVLGEAGVRKDCRALQRIATREFTIQGVRAHIDWAHAAKIVVCLSSLAVAAARLSDVADVLLEFGAAQAGAGGASAWMNFVFLAALVTLFVASSEGYIKSAGLEKDFRIIIALSQ